ncbi:hypothetical protein GIB67_025569 [Kingdonia uniflora]|uniref:Uncharacterized protein n=1 Tax=Kingdonia uniflora TaxID=39325 RepID=A0A7J7M0M1_9MAGN|nr:hypothetical protein GIB67_025569 [Kingdonia uniflora]
MAEYATVPSCSKLPLQRSFYKLSSFTPILHSCRKPSFGNFQLLLSTHREKTVFSVPTAPLLRRPMSIKESFSSCCLGTLMDLENVTPSNWTLVVDDLLLTIGVFLTYMAGIIPSQKAYSSSRQNVSNYDAVTANLTSLSSDMSSEFNPVYVRDEVRRKLMIALNAVKQDDNLNSKVDQREKSSEKLPFSLYAIAEIPRLRLLQATLQQLEKRRASCYDIKFLVQHGVDVFEDLVITLSDGITCLYLELISVDSDMSSEMSRLGLDLCSLSTRALQRLRNEVALDRWLHQNIESVISMNEDRFDLWTFQIQPLERPDINQTEKRSWWKKLIFNKHASTLPSLCSVAIKQLFIPVKRTMELRALSG